MQNSQQKKTLRYEDFSQFTNNQKLQFAFPIHKYYNSHQHLEINDTERNHMRSYESNQKHILKTSEKSTQLQQSNEVNKSFSKEMCLNIFDDHKILQIQQPKKKQKFRKYYPTERSSSDNGLTLHSYIQPNDQLYQLKLQYTNCKLSIENQKQMLIESNNQTNQKLQEFEELQDELYLKQDVIKIIASLNEDNLNEMIFTTKLRCIKQEKLLNDLISFINSLQVKHQYHIQEFKDYLLNMEKDLSLIKY